MKLLFYSSTEMDASSAGRSLGHAMTDGGFPRLQ